MRVDDAKRLRFLTQVYQDAREHRVLDHIRKVAGVERMAVVHGVSLHKTAPRSKHCRGVHRRARE